MRPPVAVHQLKASIFCLPPSVRASVYQQALPRRPFSATASHRATWTDLVVAGPTAALDALHLSGVPWYATIPITAVLVRGTLGYYVTTLPARKREIIRRHLHPLISARGRLREKETLKQFHDIQKEFAAPSISDRMRLAMLEIVIKLKYVRESHRAGKAFGASMVSWRSFFNFGTMIVFAEALRIKCGSREGLLSLMLGSTETVKDAASKTSETFEKMSADEILAYRIEGARAAQEAKAGAIAQHDPSDQDTWNSTSSVSDMTKAADSGETYLTPLDSRAYANFLDPTMREEGFAWIQDLTLPDTTLALPFVMSAILAANVFLRPSGTSKKREIASIDDNQPGGASQAQTTEPATNHAKSLEEEIAAAHAAADLLRKDLAQERGMKGPFANLTIGQRISLSMALLFFFVATKLPAAILLYIIPTMATGFVQRRWLDWKHPLPAPVHPCTTPLRIKSKRVMSDM